MDFGSVLHVAQKNKEAVKEPVRYYSTKFEPPKKEQRPAGKLSANIQKFLARRDAEEKQKLEEAKRKKDELLALRAQDKKATRRVNVMLKRTKSANQSVIDDAVDSVNTAVTLAGPYQPDEDDYGYVSQEASAFYNKMMEKYSKIPDEPKFDFTKKKVSTNLGSTKDRVRAALEREREEALLPHKRKRKHKEQSEEEVKDDDDEENEQYEEPEVEREVETPKPAKQKPRPMPPPMNFSELLKVAEKKQFEPIVIEQKAKEEERPLTKKQKKELERQREWQDRRQCKLPPADDINSKPQPFKIPKTKSSSSETNRISKVNGVTSGPRYNGSDETSTSAKSKPSSTSSSYSSSGSSDKVIPSSKDAHRYKSLDSGDKKYSSDKKPSVDYSNSLQKSSSKSSSSTGGKSTDHVDLKRREAIERDNKRSDSSSTKQKYSQGDVKSKEVPSQSTKYPTNSGNDSKLKQALEKDGAGKKYLPGDVRAKHQEDAPARKYLPGDIRAKQASREEAPARKYLPGDIRAKQASHEDAPARKYLPGDIRAKQTSQEDTPARKYLPGDIRAKQTSQEEPPARKYLPGDIRAKQQTQEDAPPRKYLPGDIRAKQASQEETPARKYLPGDIRAKQAPQQNGLKPKQSTAGDLRPKQVHRDDVRPKQFPPSDLKPKQFPPSDLKPKKFPPSDLRPKQFPPSDLRPRQQPSKGSRPVIGSKRRILDDDEDEYDSEMDDFIDDDPEEGEDYSKYIRDIFGYDKSKFSHMDDDVDNMESSFAQQMKEEIISTKIGIMEDLEDMKQEEEQKKRKAMLKKKAKLK